MYIDRIRDVFERHHYQLNSQINQQNFYQLLSQLTVTLKPFSPDNLTIETWPTNSGSKPPEAPLTSKSTPSARPSTTASASFKSNLMKSIVSTPLFRGNQDAR